MLSILYYIFLVVFCAVFLLLSAIALVLTYPFQKSRLIVHELSRIMVRTFFAVPPMWRFKLSGVEHIDPQKVYVIVVNHQAVIDIPALYFLPLNFRWVSKREVYKTPYFGQFLLLHGDICINRGNATQSMEQLLREGKLWISRGVSIAVFPEGTRSKDGQIHRFKAGAFMLAREMGVEILPVVLGGTDALIKKNAMFKWRNTVTINVLPPISAETVVSTDPHELMTQVRETMCGVQQAMREVKNNKKR